MKLIYRLSDRKFDSLGDNLMPPTDYGVIELDPVTDATLIANIRNGYVVSIDEQLMVTATKPPVDSVDAAFKAVDLTGVTQPSDLTTAQIQALVYAIAIEQGLIST